MAEGTNSCYVRKKKQNKTKRTVKECKLKDTETWQMERHKQQDNTS